MSGRIAPENSRPGNVKHLADRVLVEGVEGFNPGDFASSVQGCQARILEYLGEELTYDDLVCYGAFAFRVGLHNAMCPSAGHPCCGFDCIANSNRSLPWRQQMFSSFPWDKPKEDRVAFEAEARAVIKDSIDRGMPVHYAAEEDGLMIGYADEGQRWLCLHPYHKGGRVPFWHDEVKGFAGGQWPWAIVIWLEPKPDEERASERELFTTALKQAVEMWRTEKREDYFCGDMAYRKWLEWLRGVGDGTVSEPKAGMQGNGWCYDVLLHNRAIADRWLRQKAEGLADAVEQKLIEAADHYREIARILHEDLNWPWDLALPPNRFDDWTPAMQQDQIRRLEAAREHDEAAIAAICEALAAGPL